MKEGYIIRDQEKPNPTKYLLNAEYKFIKIYFEINNKIKL